MATMAICRAVNSRFSLLLVSHCFAFCQSIFRLKDRGKLYRLLRHCQIYLLLEGDH